MRKILPSDFRLSMYGVETRLVSITDAAFILQLRTDPEKGRFLHQDNISVEEETKWIAEHKELEKEGLEYIFIYSKNGVPFGMNRIYYMDEDDNIYTYGSWVCTPNTATEDVVASALIPRYIAFDLLDKSLEYGRIGCHVDNKKVMKFNKMIGMRPRATREEELGTFVVFNYYREDFHKYQIKLEKMLGLIR